MSFDVRTVKDLDEFTRAVFAIGQYFGMTPTEERMRQFLDQVTAERMHAAWENGSIVGGAGAFAFDLTVPGGGLPTAGVSVVGVYPTHRRRGVLRSLMRAQLDAAHERGSRSRRSGRRRRRSMDASAMGWPPSAARSRSRTSTRLSRNRLSQRGRFASSSPTRPSTCCS